jgi:hypothetical protein
MGHSLRKGVQMKIDVADAEDHHDQEDTHHDHQNIGSAWPGDIEWQVVWHHRMKLINHYKSPGNGPLRCAGRCDLPEDKA